MIHDSLEDPEGFHLAVKRFGGPVYARWAKAIEALSRGVEADLANASGSGTPRQKCEALELAKWRLGELEKASRDVPGMTLTGLPETHGRIKRLEQTFLALGFYRASGVVRA